MKWTVHQIIWFRPTMLYIKQLCQKIHTEHDTRCRFHVIEMSEFSTRSSGRFWHRTEQHSDLYQNLATCSQIEWTGASFLLPYFGKNLSVWGVWSMLMTLVIWSYFLFTTKHVERDSNFLYVLLSCVDQLVSYSADEDVDDIRDYYWCVGFLFLLWRSGFVANEKVYMKELM